MSKERKRKLYYYLKIILLPSLFLIIFQSCISREKLVCSGITCPAEMTCAPNGAPICVRQGCGDGKIAGGEECDSGGTETSDCNIDCTKSICGDGMVNQASGEQCDELSETTSCNSDCTISSCGDGKINRTSGEECDDAGESSRCNADCTNFRHGDGKVNRSAGELCDDGNLANGDGCSSTGKLEKCLDGLIDEHEQCDDGKESAFCNNDCTKRICGDRKVNVTAKEQCDDGPSGSANCNSNCTFSQCGDGIHNTLALSPREECDDGAKNIDSEDCSYAQVCEFCTTSCKKKTVRGPYCGDGIINWPPEECDIRNMQEICSQDKCTCAPPVQVTAYLKRFDSFKSNIDIVVDLNNGLVWQRSYKKELTWKAANEYCNSLKLAGCGNWRLPTLAELESLVYENSAGSPYINTEAFPNTEWFYWSSDQRTGLDHAWYLDFLDGTSASGNKMDRFHARCVR